MEFFIEIFDSIVGLFPDIQSRGFWISWMFGLLCSILCSLPRSKWYASILNNRFLKITFALALSIAIVLLTADYCLYSYLILILPLTFYPCRILLIWHKIRKTAKIENKVKRLMNELKLLDELKEKELLRWEMNIFYFPLLKVLLDIGAIKRLENELETLREDYENTFSWKQLKAFVLFNKHNYQEMIDLFRDLDKKKEYSKELKCTIINNKFCAFRNIGDNAGVDTCMRRMEKMVYEEKNYRPEFLDNMLYYYEEHNNTDGIQKVIDIINILKKKSLNNLFVYGNINYMHNKRVNNIEENRMMLDEFFERIKQSDIEEEQRLLYGLKLLRLAYENDYKWQETSLNVFKHADDYLDYSRDVALTFMEEIHLLLNNAQTLKGITLPGDQMINLFKQIYDGVGKYLPEIDKDLADLSDDFLYIKKSLYMSKVIYCRIKVSIDGDMSSYLRDVVSLEKRIVSICERNGEEREMLHFLVVLTDDIINAIMQMPTNDNSGYSITKWLSQNEIKSYRNDIREYTNTISEVISKYDYDRTLAYDIFYLSYFQNYLGNDDAARYALEKFKKTGISINNFTVAVQRLYEELSCKLHI